MKIIILLLFTFCFLFTTRNPAAAATPTPVTNNSSAGLGCGGGLGPIADFFCGIKQGNTDAEKKAENEKVGNKLNTVISGIIGFMTIIAALWFLFQILIGGYGWISSGGDKQAIEQARDRIIYSVIGLITVVSAWVIVGIIGTIIGLDVLNPGKVILNLGF